MRQIILQAFCLYSSVQLCFGFLNFLFGTPAGQFKDELVKYELYTRRNDDSFGSGTGQLFGKDYEVVRSSHFNASLPTKIFLHGWFGGSWNWYIRDTRMAMLKQVDCNFIEADWSDGSTNINYFGAKASSSEAGAKVSEFLIWLHDNFGLRYEDVHLIGHSLGSQVAGAVGKVIQSPKIGRISGLDPAQPGFNLNSPDETLGPEDATFVDIIHTTLVATEPMGHVDFYPNGGNLGIPLLSWVHTHLQAAYIYTETINSKCSFTAYKCGSYKELLSGRCPTYCGADKKGCNYMGYHASPDQALGSLQIQIKESHPYC